VFLGLTIVSAYLIARHEVSKQLETAWKLGDEFGLPNDLNELFGSYVPERDNAAGPLDEAAKIAELRVTAARQRWKLSADDQGLDNSAYVAEIAALLNDSAYQANLASADARPAYRSLVRFADPLNSTDMTHVHRRRFLTSAEEAVALQLATAGRRDEAVRRLVRVLRLMRKSEAKEPFAISIALNAGARWRAVEGLNMILRNGGPLAPAVHRAIDDELAAQETILQAIPWTSRSERLLQAQELERSAWRFRDERLMFGSMLEDRRMARMLTNGHRATATWNLPFSEAKELDKAIRRGVVESGRMPAGGYLNGRDDALASSIFTIRDCCTRLTARCRCLRVVNAWAEKGDFTLPLDALGLQPTAIADPFDGQWLRVKPTDEGPVVYAVGPDLKDDGGDIGEYPKDQGLGPPAKREIK